MINAAQHNGFATYQEIAPANGFQLRGNVMGNKISELIGLVSKNEVNQGRPMMSAGIRLLSCGFPDQTISSS